MASKSNSRPVNVLFVCLGNICRSPMAEGVFRNLAKGNPAIGEIDSAGTGAYHSLEPPDYRTMETLKRHGITNYNHAARKVTREDFLKFDYLLAMDESNLDNLLHTRKSVMTSLGKKSEPQSFAKNTRSATENAIREHGADTKVAQVRLFELHDAIGGGEVVEDPYYGGSKGFENVYKQVTRFSQGFLDYVTKADK
ncbi:Protein-tyrosine phosphatase low molecular weight mammalian [Penicillium chermesinum]|nr:Protein-tyrosine phosphatase low molecular weight mammalian [Penicillium chermesinum]